MTPTVREMVADIQREMRGDELQPHRAAELLVRLSSLYGNVLLAIRESDLAYMVALSGLLPAHKSVKAAEIEAATTPAYQSRQEARHLEKLVEQLIGSLKYLLKNAESEMRLSR